MEVGEGLKGYGGVEGEGGLVEGWSMGGGETVWG